MPRKKDTIVVQGVTYAPIKRKHPLRDFLVLVMLVSVVVIVIAAAANSNQQQTATPASTPTVAPAATSTVQLVAAAAQTPIQAKIVHGPGKRAPIRLPTAGIAVQPSPTAGLPRAVLQMTAMVQTQPDGYDAISDKVAAQCSMTVDQVYGFLETAVTALNNADIIQERDITLEGVSHLLPWGDPMSPTLPGGL
jgi:hypothetical protein